MVKSYFLRDHDDAIGYQYIDRSFWGEGVQGRGCSPDDASHSVSLIGVIGLFDSSDGECRLQVAEAQQRWLGATRAELEQQCPFLS